MTSYLGEPFEYDLFVSYSQGEPRIVEKSNLRQWSKAFVSELEQELRMEQDLKDLNIFFDQDHRPAQGVDPMAPLSGQLREKIGGAGILTILMSPHYLQSQWCLDELTWWIECQAKNGEPPEGRIMVVRIWPTDDTPWPAPLIDSNGHRLLGVKFYDDEQPRPFEWPDPTGAKDPFRATLIKLVGILFRKLSELKGNLEERRKQKEQTSRLAAGAGQFVYVHGRQDCPDHIEKWKPTVDSLRNNGFCVFPIEGPEPIEADPLKYREASQRRVEILSTCDGLLLLGAREMQILAAELAVVGHQERNLARALKNGPLPCAVLNTLPAGEFPVDSREQARRLGIGWIEAAGEDWTSGVRAWLGRASLLSE